MKVDITSNAELNINFTGYFNGKPIKVFEEWHIVLPRGDMKVGEFVASEEFQMLEESGFEVHGGAYS